MLRKAECPNCRSPIQSCVHSIVMDNYIEKTIEYLGKEQQDYRKQALADRKGMSVINKINPNSVI